MLSGTWALGKTTEIAVCQALRPCPHPGFPQAPLMFFPEQLLVSSWHTTCNLVSDLLIWCVLGVSRTTELLPTGSS